MRRVLALVVAASISTACGGGGGGGTPGGGTPTAATPTFTPPGATYVSAQSVSIQTATPGAVIHYTTDGSAPTATSPTYAAAVPVAATQTLKAFATATGYLDSAVGTATYTIAPTATPAATPVITPGSGSYASAQSVTITCTTPGAAIHYTTDGTTPTGTSTPYAGAIPVQATTTIKAIATAAGYTSSAVATATLTINVSVADFATFCSGLDGDLTALGVSCLKANPAAGPFGPDCTALSVDILAGRAVYDAAHAADCRTAITGAGCALFGSEGGPPPECRLAVAGQQAAGGTCFDDTSCGAGLFCDASSTQTCPGQCAAYAQAGQACPSGSACAPGLACDPVTVTCKAPSAAGLPCPCRPGLYCGAGSLCAPQQTSGACTGFEQCAIGYACDGFPSGTCLPLVGLGGNCTAGAGVCGQGYHCSGGTCVSDPAAGQACTPGASCLGGFCDGVTSTCVADTTLGSCGSKPALAGLTLFDAFHGTALDGTRWQNASFTRAVDAGAAVLGVEVDNERRRSDRNDNYASIVNVVGAGRVTTLQSTITVPAASAVATGGTVMRAVVRLLYSPPLNRLSFPGGNQDLFIAEVGLREEGSGLTAFRQFTHCDVASCASLSTSGVTYVDPAGFAPVGNGNASGAPAAHDTLYTATVSLDEVTGIFHWTIAGGAFGAGVSGTADPAAYLAGNAGWTGVAMAGAGYNAAQIGVRSNDDGAGGGSARLKARFDDVQVGRNNGAAAPFDDFGGTGDNSGPADLSPAKWNPHGTTRVLTSGGSLLVQSRAIAAAAGTIINGNGIPFGDPASVNAVQFLAGFESVTTTGTSGLGSVGITGRYYSDGTHTRANDATGDVSAFLTLTSTGLCTYGLNRCTNATCSTTTPVGFGVLSSAVTPGVHRLVSRWNPTARSFDFGVDGLTITVDPTTASAGVTAPVAYGAGPNAPFRVLSSSANVTAAAAGQSTAVTLRIVDVFTGP